MRPKMNRKFIIIIPVALVALSIFYKWIEHLDSRSSVSTTTVAETKADPAADQFHQVARVIDGDTFVLTDSTRIRLIGVDTPERGQPGADRATAFLKASVLEQNITLRYDQDRTDRYGRTLAYVYVGDISINEELLKKGLAKATPRFDFREKDRYLAIEAKAKRQRLGLWSR